VSRQREILALLTAAATLAGAGAAPAKSRPTRPCDPPRSGYIACLQVLYQHAPDGSANQIRVTARLMQRVNRCPARPGRRVVTLLRSGQERLGRARDTGTCRGGVMRWSVRFGPARTQAWQLQPGDSVDASWTGTTAKTSVEISPPATPPALSRVPGGPGPGS
jgi:hypothetical protein